MQSKSIITSISFNKCIQWNFAIAKCFIERQMNVPIYLNVQHVKHTQSVYI